VSITDIGSTIRGGGTLSLLELDDVVVRFGGVLALDGPTFAVGEREICGLIGPIKVQTGPDDGYALEAMQIMRFHGNRWKLVGDVVQKPH
jgi:hypothetical protein